MRIKKMIPVRDERVLIERFANKKEPTQKIYKSFSIEILVCDNSNVCSF
jgi:hypothetical protein